MKKNHILRVFSAAIALPLLALSLYPTISQGAVVPNGSLTVIQHVINNGGGTLSPADFPIHVTLNGVEVAGSPAAGIDVAGRTYSLAPGVYEVTQPDNLAYVSTYSALSTLGDTTTVTTALQTITVTSLHKSVMTVTNNDINLGTLHIVKNVINRYTGKSVAGDFVMHVKLHNVDVVGSPAAGVGGAGRTYRLLPGQYAVQEDEVAGYFGNFDGPELSNGYVTVVSDQEVTVSRTNYDKFVDNYVPTPIPPVVIPSPPVTPETPAPGTVTGGTLPKTGTPWNNLLALGGGLMLIGVAGLRSRKALK